MCNAELHSWKFNLAKSVLSYAPSRMMVPRGRGFMPDMWEVVGDGLYIEIAGIGFAGEKKKRKKKKIYCVKARGIGDDPKILGWANWKNVVAEIEKRAEVEKKDGEAGMEWEEKMSSGIQPLSFRCFEDEGRDLIYETGNQEKDIGWRNEFGNPQWCCDIT